jgi:hypothetical protein
VPAFTTARVLLWHKDIYNQLRCLLHVVQVEYTPDQLDLLALGFTAAKVLYVGGALTAAAR